MRWLGSGYLGAFLSLAGCATAMHGSPASCVAAPMPISRETDVLDVLHVITGPDGLSHADVEHETAQTSTYLGAVLRQFSLGDPSNVVIVSGPPGFRIPTHPAPYREMFFLLAGSSVIELSDGTRHPLQAGSLVLFEDLTGPGHGGLFGACGYVALDLQFKTAALGPAAH